MSRQVKAYLTESGEQRFRVRYRLGGQETSETFRRKTDAETFRDILGDGRNGRTLEAVRWLQAKQEDRDTFTFSEWHEMYVDQLTGITPRTRDDYRAYRRRYLAELDPLPLPLISRAHVARIVNRLEAEGKSPKTIKNTIHMLSSCMSLAVDDGLIPANPCRRVRLPKEGLDVHEPQFLTSAEVSALIAALPEHYRPLVAFVVGSGLRWSEATALEGRHVNLTAGTVRVEQAWKRVKGKGMVLGPPKSSKARRTVNPAVMGLYAAASVMRGPKDLVFTTPAGGVIHYGPFRSRVWVPACDAAGLDPRPGFHALRHTHASWLLSDGVPLEAVQDQLGHESFETTRKIYAHLLPAVGVAVGKAASAALARALPDGVKFSLPPAAIEPMQGEEDASRPVDDAPDVADGSHADQ